MKKSTSMLVSLCSVYFLASGIALAESADVFIDENGCGVLTEFSFAVGDLHQVTANNDNGNIKVSCSVDLEERTSTGRSVIFNYDNTYLECSIGTSSGSVKTTDWHQTISASGKARLTCHYKG